MMTSDDILSRVLYRDGLILIIDKPAGLPVHAGPGGGENLESSFVHLRYGLPRAPSLAHRLDRDTSGCLILGRHPKALRRVGRHFSGGTVDKVYWAVVEGSPPEDEGVVDLALRKRTGNKSRWWMVVDVEGGKSALTHYRVLGRSEKRTWVEFRPKTGRTHQIRVHAEALGCPIVGEPYYGRGGSWYDGGPMLHLHSQAISLKLYPKKPPVGAIAEPPEHMLEALKACGYSG